MTSRHLWVGVVATLLLLPACGGGGGGSSIPAASSTPTPAATPTPTPTPVPPPGAVQLSYSSSFGPTVAATSAPPPIAYQANAQTVALTATESNYTGSYSAVSSCAQVTVAPATSATGAFTLTSVNPAATGCTITVTGATGQTAAVSATVPNGGGVQMRWVGPGYQNFPQPIQLNAGPVNIIGLGSLFSALLVVTETSYNGGSTPFVAPVVSGAGCGASNVTVAPVTPVVTVFTPPSNSSVAYYSVTAANAAVAGSCSISAKDNLTPQGSGSINVIVTTGTGGFQ